jgi:aspartate kinase
MTQILREVYKTGGTSTSNNEDYERIAALLRGKTQTAIAVSAPVGDEKVTDLLIDQAKGNDRCYDVIGIFSRINPLGIRFDDQRFIYDLVHARDDDELISLGELHQAQHLVKYLNKVGINAKLADPTQILKMRNGRITETSTDSIHGADVYVMPGFYGLDLDTGRRSALPRGGTDITADWLAAITGANSYTNLKEIPGVLAADPDLLRPLGIEPLLVPDLTFREMRELAYAGTRVLQAYAMEQCRKAGIPIIIRSLRHEGEGTRLVSRKSKLTRPFPIAGIATEPGFTVYSFDRTSDPTRLTQALEVLANEGISFDMLSTENGTYSIAIKDSELEGKAPDRKLSETVHYLKIFRDRALVSVVSERIDRARGFIPRIQRALSEEGLVPEAIYGQLLAKEDTTVFDLRKFGMNGTQGFGERYARVFSSRGIPITQASTTIDSMSLGGVIPDNQLEGIIKDLQRELEPDALTVSKDGLLLRGPPRFLTNLSVTVHADKRAKAVQALYKEFF